ncbi:8-amino-7-oxononanoate synthase [Candidatus Trichorickettsia mobilis]|uniref:5-aminolevulinate synthase n=1 Tax=Candidatus Trichorickettsia mobilis TaxID=1346319 RepID=A0ABZ0UXE8_9RICK|nr:8-amino-7-oxononanoate synthase [Candidatus Trichorickettsia mobilis]WPY00749.1 8-amino-7-oxononanoate synthase [Candidatus Trichorickettsia mobilis]
MHYDNKYTTYCLKLQNTAKYRQLPEISDVIQKDLIDFSSNDYLNLSRNKELLQAAKQAAEYYGVGSTGSRLLSGNSELFEEFERQIAKDKATQTALIWNSGFQANISALSSLLDEAVLGHKALVFCDRFNHSSLYQAIFLSKAELVRYQHNDMNHLAELLHKHTNDRRAKFIISETLYGMDGDQVPLLEITNLASQHQAFLYLDEAHATGILGVDGYGMSTDFNLENIPHLVMGTFSKAIGVSGAYTASNMQIKNYLINKSAGFIYSTALSPMIIGAAYYGWVLLKKLKQERQNLLQSANALREQIKQLGFDTGVSTTHIIPILLGAEKDVLNAQQILLNYGIIVAAIRPPTVPPNKSRLRIALTLKHQSVDFEKLLMALKYL